MKRITSMIVCLSLVFSLGATSAWANGLGTDFSSLNFCLYPDCETRGSFAADPYGWVNPATLGASFDFFKRGAMVSSTYYAIRAGGVNADLYSVTGTLAYEPAVLQINFVGAKGDGGVDDYPGTNLEVNVKVLRLTGAYDLTRHGLKGLTVGILAALPVVDEDLELRLDEPDLRLSKSSSERTADVTVGVHWRGGEKSWLMIGGFINPQKSRTHSQLLDLNSGQVVSDNSTNHNIFGRVGVSVVPGIPLHFTGLLNDWLGDARLGADFEYRRIDVPGEGVLKKPTGYFGVDWRVVPDRWNPISHYLRLYGVAGADTMKGYGLGLGLYGNPDGPLNWFSCNGGWSSRPLVSTIGRAVETATIGCSLVATF